MVENSNPYAPKLQNNNWFNYTQHSLPPYLCDSKDYKLLILTKRLLFYDSNIVTLIVILILILIVTFSSEQLLVWKSQLRKMSIYENVKQIEQCKLLNKKVRINFYFNNGALSVKEFSWKRLPFPLLSIPFTNQFKKVLHKC